MGAKFLNDRLVTTRRFTPEPTAAEEDQPVRRRAATVEGPPSGTTDAPKTPAKSEDDRVRAHSVAERSAELRRRHAEVVRDLSEAITTIERRQRAEASAGATFRQRLDTLTALDELVGGEMNAEALRRVGQEVHDGHVELMKFEAESAGPEEDPRPALLSLTFGQLTRMGLALTWPLILAVLLAAGIVILGFVATLGM